MLATVDKDIVVVLGRGTVTIPDDYPRNVGWERLRWDGERVVDLADLEGFWVEWNGCFFLHCKEFDGCTYVTMSYTDRFNLILDNGVPRLQTQEELTAKATVDAIANAKAEFARLIEKQDTLYEVVAFTIGLISAALIYARTPNATLRNQIGANIDKILDELQALPLQRMLQNAEAKLTRLKGLLETFYGKIDAAGG